MFKQVDSWFFGDETYDHDKEELLYFRGNNLFTSGDFLKAYKASRLRRSYGVKLEL